MIVLDLYHCENKAYNNNNNNNKDIVFTGHRVDKDFNGHPPQTLRTIILDNAKIIVGSQMVQKARGKGLTE